jgi:hypothetical protein
MLLHPSSLVLFVTAALVLLLIPGPAVFYIVGRSIGHGRSAGLVSALGISVGSLVHTAAAAVGLSALLMSSAVAFAAVKYLGAAYLIYLGIQKIRREEPFELSGDAPAREARPHLRPRHRPQRVESEGGAVFLRLSPAIRGCLPGSCGVANTLSGCLVRAARAHDRHLLGHLRGHGGQSLPAQRSRHAYATIYQRWHAHFAGVATAFAGSTRKP